MPEVECPLEGCDYAGEPRSVEAHISGCRDDIHKGEVGRFHRDAITGEETEPVEEDDVESLDQPEPVPDADDDDRADDRADDGAAAGAAAAGVTALGAGAAAMEGSSGEVDDATSGGLLTFDTVLVILAVAGIALLTYLILTSDSSQSEGSQSDEQVDEQESGDVGEQNYFNVEGL